MNITIPVYQTKRNSLYEWTTVGLGPHTLCKNGHSVHKVQQSLIGDLRRVVEGLKPSELPWFQLVRGTRLERLRLELGLRGEGRRRKVTGLCPLIVEPRWVSVDRRMLIAYHPARQAEWFPVREDEPFDQQASLFLQKVWSELGDEEIAGLWSNGKDLLKVASFGVEPRILLDQLPDSKKGIWADLEVDPARAGGKKEKKEKGYKLLYKLGTNLTSRSLEGGLKGGLPRSPFRERLQLLLCNERKQSTLVVGPPGSGKTTLLNQWIADLIAADDYPSHQNPDRLHDVWSLSGKRIIAGMSYVGDWEQRCAEILDDARHKKVVLLLDDLYLFGQIGRSRQSDRCLADVFRGPVSRGEVVLVGECTAEQYRRLEDDVPSFAALFTQVHLAPTTPAETFRMLLHEARELERKDGGLPLAPYALRSILEMGGSLFPNYSFPGKALDLLRQIHKEKYPAETEIIEAPEVVRFLSKKTGLPELLLRPEEPLGAGDLEAEFSRQVIGQPEAIRAASDLILRIKAGLTDPRRPYGVYLFTGPTGTGKTELAKCIAEYLFGQSNRLLRFDMSEYGGPDAVARLIGDRWQPEGLLTRQVLEQPFCVVLFDEIEKAHPSILNLLLQLFDEGRLTDAQGTTASFTHAVVVMTSNLGAKREAQVGFGDQSERVLSDVARAVREFFPPELFNRIDRVVPFAPLRAEIASSVAQKEMTRLFARRGLADRNIFIYVSRGVADLVARQAFSQQDGARSLKRHIEANIGSVLADHISRGGQATMQVVRIYEAGGAIHVDVEPLLEAETAAFEWTLEPLLDLPLAALQERLVNVLTFLDELTQSEQVKRLSESIHYYLEEHNLGHREHADQLYNLDATRLELNEFRERVAGLIRVQDTHEIDYELIEFNEFAYLQLTPPDGYRSTLGSRIKLLDRRGQESRGRRPVKSEILACMAETEFLRRALTLVHDATQHAVFIELSKTGHGAPADRFGKAGEGLLSWMTLAYAGARGTLDEFTLQLRDGELLEGRGPAAAEALASHFVEQHVERVTLKIVGLCVLDFFALETGCHVWHSLAEQPEIVQVRVTSAPPGVSSKAVVEAQKARRAAFDLAQREGGPLVENPDRLLPAVRKLRFDPPRRAGAPSLIDVEDYVLGYSTSTWVLSLQDALPRLWMLRMSRRPISGSPDAPGPDEPALPPGP
jgi:ATP-dependent Clp protease ATP-binding subunit ClpA/ATP-dependent Clp protease ATP-binding subunit ClpC